MLYIANLEIGSEVCDTLHNHGPDAYKILQMPDAYKILHMYGNHLYFNLVS